MARKKSTPESTPTETPDPFDPELDAPEGDDLGDDVPDDPDLPDEPAPAPVQLPPTFSTGHALAPKPETNGRAFEDQE